MARSSTRVMMVEPSSSSHVASHSTLPVCLSRLGRGVFPGRTGCVVRGGVEPPTFRFSGGRSYRLSYLTSTSGNSLQQALRRTCRLETDMPTTDPIVRDFALALAAEGKKPKTIRTYTDAATWLQKTQGVDHWSGSLRSALTSRPSSKATHPRTPPTSSERYSSSSSSLKPKRTSRTR